MKKLICKNGCRRVFGVLDNGLCYVCASKQPREDFKKKKRAPVMIRDGRNTQTQAKLIYERRKKVYELINTENKQNPLTDRQIIEQLKGLGYHATEIIVVKDREHLGFGGSTKRKREALKRKARK